MPDTDPTYSRFKHSPKLTSSKLSTINNTNNRVNRTEESVAPPATKKLNAAGTLLKNKHPELFYVAPRPGGFLKYVAPQRNDSSRTRIQDEETEDEIPARRSYVVVGNDNPTSVTMRDVLETRIPCPNFHKISKDEERDNMVRLCSTAITTIMMLAQRAYEDVTVEHVKHTELYFRALRQEDGYPRNVGQLMQVLSNLKKSRQIATPPSEELLSEEEGGEVEEIQISDIIN